MNNKCGHGKSLNMNCIACGSLDRIRGEAKVYSPAPTVNEERGRGDQNSQLKYTEISCDRGMAPAAEVERLKSERDLAKMGWNQAKENHAAEVERLKERIRKATGVLFAECQPDKGDLFAAVDDVLNPKEPRND